MSSRRTNKASLSCRLQVEQLEERSIPSVLAWGDFNGDRYADLAVGLPNETVGTVAEAGVVRVWHGTATGLVPSGIPVWSQDSKGIQDTAEASDHFGSALTAGDFNGDGFGDLAIGVPDEDTSGIPNAGVVQVLYGSVTGLKAGGNQRFLQGTNGVVHLPGHDDQFGAAVAAGDFNSDGFSDLIIGVPGNRVGVAEVVGAGTAIVIYGSANRLTTSGNRGFDSEEPGMLGDAQEGEHFGTSFAVGDFDGDGRDDVAVGIPKKNELTVGATDAGAVSVIYGSPSGLTAAGNQLFWQGGEGLADVPETGDLFGLTLAATDINGDGKDDLIIGVPEENIGDVVDAGAVHVLYGTSAGLTTVANEFWTQETTGLAATETDDRFSSALNGIDLNGDGFGDVIVGTAGEDTAAQDTGLVQVVYGSSTGLNAASTRLWSQDSPGIQDNAEAGEGFGTDLAAGDFNRDGRPDLAVLVPGEGIGNGALAVIYNSANGLTADGNQLVRWKPGNVRLIPVGSTWRYLDDGSDQGTEWRAAAFNDSAWAAGTAQLGYGEGDEATIVSFGSNSQLKHITTYFRRDFTVADASLFSDLTVRLLRDDGAVVYLNGVEVFRSNMPTGGITHTTLASSTADGAAESTYYEIRLPASLLVSGTNILAVELHQVNRSSSDLSFDLELLGTPIPSKTLVNAGSTWRYLDDGSDQGTAWRASGFNDTTWASGAGQFGYGDGDETTLVSFGSDPNRKHVTTYFRQEFVAPDPSLFSALTLRLLRDDGAVVYLNGVELTRSNMPTGDIGYRTLASSGVSGSAENIYHEYSIPGNLLVSGTNVLAVEVHQFSRSSEDTSFDLELIGIVAGEP